MNFALAAVLFTSTFTIYPGAHSSRDSRIEAVTDRGPILEMIVRCPAGTAIITYSKMEHLYCQPNMQCGRDVGAIIRRSCR